MINKIGILILLISFFHLVSSFPPALGNRNKCKSRNGNFPKAGSLCRSYYLCKNWNPEEKVCPEDQHFFPAKGYCVWPEEFPCLEKPKSKECPVSNGKFLKPGTECKEYYDCCDGVPTVKKCRKDLLFDHVREKCDWPEYVTCPEEPKSKECKRRDGNFLKPGTGCRIFYECRNGISSERRCPDDQLFDPNAEKCEWPEIYTCVEEPKSRECIRPNGKFLRPGTRCRIYYDCRNGVATERRCPDDSLFDPEREKCEWPEVYTCVEDATTTGSSSRSTSIPVTSTLVSNSPEEKEIVTTGNPISPKTVTPDSDEDNSKENSSSEEGDSSEEDKLSSTKYETKSTPPDISTTSFVESTELPEDLTTSSTESSSTLENSSKSASSTEAPDDGLTVSEIFTTPTTSITSDIESTELPVDLTTSTSESSSIVENTSIVASSTETEDDGMTPSEIFTSPIISTADVESTELPVDLTTLSTESSSTIESSSKATSSTTVLDNGLTVTEMSTTSSTEEYDGKTYTYPEIVTDKTQTELTEPVKKKESESTTMTPGLTDSVTYPVFCPKPSGYFPHPNDKHKFIACIGGNPIIMDCPEDLVYDHEKRSCEYDI